MHIYVSRLARFFALLGGLALSALIILTCLSILGRSVNSLLQGDLIQTVIPGFSKLLLATGIGPVNGDFELVEVGMVFAIFAFLPLCNLNGAHASVDIFIGLLPQRVRDAIRMIVELIFAAVLILIAIQLFAGMVSKRGSGQTTLLLGYPLWWGYAASVPGAVVAALVAVYIAACRFVEVLTGRTVLPVEMEASH